MTLFGIPVRIEPSFLFITAMVGLMGRGDIVSMVSWVVAVFVSILVHEMGHALLMKYYGFRPFVVLHGFGGYAVPEGYGRTTLWRQVAISLAGPGAGFVLGFVALGLYLVIPVTLPVGIAMLLQYLMYTTFFWGFLNLLPMMPLDGGNVARLLFIRFLPGRPRWSWYLSIVVAVASIGASIAFGMIFWAVISASSVVQAVQEIRRLPATVPVAPSRPRAPAGQAVAFRRRAPDAHGTPPAGASPDDDPLQASRAAFVRSPDAATGEALVTAFIGERRFSALAAIAAGPDGKVIPAAALAVAAGAALEAGVPKAAVELGVLAHRRGAGVHVSPLLARAHGRLGDRDEAAAWVQAALSDGVPDPEGLRRAPELALLADDPRWAHWMPGA